MNIKKIWRLYHGFALSVAFFSVSIVGFIFGVYPVIRSSIDILSQVQALEDHVTTLTQKENFLRALDEESLRQELLTLLSAVPSDKSIPTIFSTIDNVVGQTGLSLADMTVTNPGSLATEAATRKSTEEKKIGVSLIPFSLTLRGSPSQIADFFSKVISVRRLVRVRTFEAAIDHSQVTNLRVDLDSFYSPLPSSLGKVDQKLATLTPEEENVIQKLAAYPWGSQSIFSTSAAPPQERANPFSR